MTETIQYDFEACLKLPPCFELFFSFLKTEEHNEEPLEFLQEVSQFQKQVLLLSSMEVDWSQTIQRQIQTIFKTFVEENGVKTLNLDFSKRTIMAKQIEELENILSQWQQRQTINLDSLKTKLHHFFAPLTSVISFQLHSDSFPRFIRHSSWLSFCQQNQDLVNQQLKKTKFIKLYSTAEFYDPMFHDRDIELAKFIISDSNKWKLRKSFPCRYHNEYKDIIDFYEYTDPFVISDMPKLKNVICRKFTHTMPFYYKHMFRYELDKRRWEQEDRTNVKVIHRYTPSLQNQNEKGKYAFAKLQYIHNIALFRGREYVVNYLLQKVKLEDGTKALIILLKTVKDETLPLMHKKNMRVDIYACVAYIKLSKTVTRVVKTVFMNFGGMLQPLFKMFIPQLSNFVKKTNGQLYKELKELQVNDYKDVEDSFDFKPIFDYNKSVQ